MIGAGCGGGASRSDDDTERPRIAVVMDATEAVKTARIETTMEFAGFDDGESTLDEGNTDMHVEGVVDFENDRGSMVQTLGSDDEQFETRWIGTRVWVKVDMGILGGAGKPWTVIDLESIDALDPCFSAEPDSSSLSALGGLVSGFGFDMIRPDEIMQRIRDEGGKLTERGREEIRGVATTRWSVDMSGYEPPPPKEGCEVTDTSSLPAAPDSTTYEIWTDEDGRVRRLRLSSDESSGSGGTITMNTELYDFGTAVTVEEPPADQVLDMSSVMRGPGTVSEGDWRAIATSEPPGTWTIWFAKSSYGQPCFDVQIAAADGTSVPDLEGLAGDASTMLPLHDGRPASCLDGAVTASVVLVDDGALGTGTSREIVGAAATGNDTAELTFADGATASVPIAADTHLFRWTDPSGRKVTTIRVSGPNGSSICTMAFDFEASDDVLESMELPCTSLAMMLGGDPSALLDLGANASGSGTTP
jgi:hypothetical protein